MLTESDVIDRLRLAGCVYAEEEAVMLMSAANSPEELKDLLAQRASGLPLEHVLGWAEFLGHRIEVDRSVFVPRVRSEFLAREAIRVTPSDAVVVDLCCGSGALGVIIALDVSGVTLYAADIDPLATACAVRNVARVNGLVYTGDLYDALPKELLSAVDTLVVNAPYVPTDAIPLMPREARLYESLIALDGGSDGLDVQRRVAQGAKQWLKPGGLLLVETSRHQAEDSRQIFADNGLKAEITIDEALEATVVIGSFS